MCNQFYHIYKKFNIKIINYNILIFFYYSVKIHFLSFTMKILI